MTTSLECDWPTLTGRQEPESLLFDVGDQSEADKALEFARRIDRPQMPWQQDSTRGILALEPTGLFTHPTVVILAGRQSGKTLTAAEFRIVFGLFVRGEKIVYSAQRWKTAESIFKRIKRLVESRPSLKRRVVRWTCSQGQASIELASGATAEFITRSLDSGRGLDEIDVIIYDESYNLKDAETAALSPTQLASKNPQTIYLSSAVNQEIHANGHVLAGIRQRALIAIAAGTRRIGLYFAEYMAPPPPDDISEARRRAIREDPETWRLSSPSFGVIQTESKVRKLLTELSPKDFEVEVLGWGDWPVVGGSVKPISPEKWGDRCDPEPLLIGRHPRAIGVDRSPLSKVWCIGGAQYTELGAIHGEIGFNDKAALTEVVEKLVAIVTEADPAALVIDQQSPAAILKPYLIQAGIEPVMTNLSELAMACGGILEAIETDHYSHSGQQILADSVACTIKRELPGKRFVWDAITGGSIAQMNAVTLAHWGLLTFGQPPKQSAPPMSDQDGGHHDNSDRDHDEFDAMAAAF